MAPYLFVIVLDYVMRNIFAGREEEYGFTLQRRRSSRVKAITVTDFDFADDLAITTEEMEKAQEILLRLEHEAGKVGLICTGVCPRLCRFEINLKFNPQKLFFSHAKQFPSSDF